MNQKRKQGGSLQQYIQPCRAQEVKRSTLEAVGERCSRLGQSEEGVEELPGAIKVLPQDQLKTKHIKRGLALALPGP